MYLLGVFQLFAASKEFFLNVGQMGRSAVSLGSGTEANTLGVGGITTVSAPAISPAYLGVGYIIGPRLAALNFSGGVVAWGLLVPLLMYFLGPAAPDDAPGRRGRGVLERPGDGHLALHRSAHRRRRHAGGRQLHALQNA